LVFSQRRRERFFKPGQDRISILHMQELAFQHITTDPISLPVFSKKNISVSVLRLDRIHPLISGNKWFKLQYYIRDAVEKGKRRIITFGGAYSNHIIATAAACSLHKLDCTGIIRGEEPAQLSPTLEAARKLGMELLFISRDDYSTKKIPEKLLSDDHYLINEGGYGIPGARGAATINEYFNQHDFSHICCATGTGTMMAGLINGSLPGQQVIGISVMKNNYAMEDAVRFLLEEKQKPFQIIHDYHFGGYAKHNSALINFMNEFYTQTGIPSDFVYTAKLFYAVNDLAANDFFPSQSRLLLVHSGGLQGNFSLSKGTLIF
jgi:1-aminocyclopropane-1-carboxylate deaminase